MLRMIYENTIDIATMFATASYDGYRMGQGRTLKEAVSVFESSYEHGYDLGFACALRVHHRFNEAVKESKTGAMLNEFKADMSDLVGFLLGDLPMAFKMSKGYKP